MRKLCVLFVLATVTSGALAATSGSVLMGLGYGRFEVSPSPRGAMLSGEQLQPPIYIVARECFRRTAAETLVHAIEGLPANVLESVLPWDLQFLDTWSHSACRLPAGDSDDVPFQLGGK